MCTLCPRVFKDKDKLRHSPMAFCASPESLNQPFAQEVWQSTVAYVLGVPLPDNVQLKGQDGLLRPCCHCNAQLDAHGRHKLVCKYSGKKTAHDHLGQSVQAVARPALLGYTDNVNHVPPHADSNQKGDALLNLSHGIDLVLDFTVVHPRGPAGQWNKSALRTAYNSKMAKHNHAYSAA